MDTPFILPRWKARAWRRSRLGPGLALAHCVILPLPVTQREEILHTPLSEEEVTLSQVLDYMEAGQILCGGLVSPAVRAAGEQRACTDCP